MPILNILFFLLFLLVIFSFLSLAPWVPTKSSDFKRIHKFAKLKKGQKFLEVGCGTGSVALYMAESNNKSEIIGIELSPLFYLISKIRVYFSRLQNIKIQYGNALKQNFGNYDVIYIFGLPATVSKKIYPKLEKEMKKGSRILSYCFKVEDDKVEVTQHKEKETLLSIYEYVKS